MLIKVSHKKISDAMIYACVVHAILGIVYLETFIFTYRSTGMSIYGMDIGHLLFVFFYGLSGGHLVRASFRYGFMYHAIKDPGYKSAMTLLRAVCYVTPIAGSLVVALLLSFTYIETKNKT